MNPEDPETPLERSEACPECGAFIVTDGLSLLAEVSCPFCSANIVLRKFLGPFNLEEKIGQGGMGQVFRAQDTSLNREIALKVLHPSFSGSIEEMAKLEIEAQRTASINHPNVVKVYGSGSAEGQFYLAMELVPEGTLDDLIILQGRVSEMQVLSVATQIAGGLEAAHAVGLIHRDIKPGNILFADPNTAKLVDFGLALVMDEVAAAKGEIWGTPYYIAPEKLDGGDEDLRSDIYSLGGTIFHALAGRPPYEAETASMVALKQLKSQPVSIQSFAPNITDETSYVINRMMAKNPDERYQTYAELTEHLVYCRQKLIERVQNPSSVGRQHPVQVESKQQRSLIGMIVLLSLVGILLLGGILYFNQDRVAEALGRPVTNVSPSRVNRTIDEARKVLLAGDFAKAASLFRAVATSQDAPQPQRNWAALQLDLAYLSLLEIRDFYQNNKTLRERPLYSEASNQIAQAGFFREIGSLLDQSQGTVRARNFPSFNMEGYESFASLLIGNYLVVRGAAEDGEAMLRRFVESADPGRPQHWIEEYKPYAEALISIAPEYSPLAEAARRARNPDQIKAALENVQSSSKINQPGLEGEFFRALEKHLTDKLEPSGS